MSNAATAGLFPGQGSHTSELGEQVQRVVPELFDRCVELVGEDPFSRAGESTRFAQPAIFCASIAGWSEHGGLRTRPIALAGHSLGELSALVAAEALDPLAGLELAVRRGELMDAACSGEQGMVAILGATEELPAELAREHGLVIANDNAPGQVVLAGPLAQLREATAAARAQGARALALDVAGAFHSPSMAVAVEPFREALDHVELRTPAVSVISCSTARPFSDVRAELAAAIVMPVRWRETMLALGELGANTFIDFGPGKVLARLVRRNLPDASTLELDELATNDGLAAADGREASGVV